ncbi:Zf-CCHC domain-containing protein/UBN2 domain-containing protein [Abeliophyllum distichum]|uniref:Zf-CCHC domain-containing protein/UBN2 domain-containing protein n=1 Tax=Abeliophyllum distichum TaxID=126358 RepID=A0ABD1Q887_9LAMI
MLRSLSKNWNSLRMLIENTKDVNTYPLEELNGTLMTYEINNAETKKKTRKSKEEMKVPPKRYIALKSTNDEGSSNVNISNEELDDLVLLVNKWRRFRNNRRVQKKDDKGEEKTKKIICYDCDKPCHNKTECPNKKKFTKKKTFQATWDYSNEDDLEEDEVQEEISNICFMAIEEEVSTNNNDSYIDLSTSYDEIFEEFEKLVSLTINILY